MALKPRQRAELPPYTDYLLRRCASLYLVFQRVNIHTFLPTNELQENLVSLLAAHHILGNVARTTKNLVVEMHRTLSSTEIIESYSAAGYLDIAASIKNMLLRSRPPVWRRVRRGPTPTERLCLCGLIARTISAARKLVSSNNIDNYLENVYGVNFQGFSYIEELQRNARNATKDLEIIFMRECGHRAIIKGYDVCINKFSRRNRRLRKLFQELINATEAFEKTVNKSIANIYATRMRARSKASDKGSKTARKLALRMFLEKLYELYVLYIVLQAFSKLGNIEAKEDSMLVKPNKKDRQIRIFYNSVPRVNGTPLSRVALGKSEQLDTYNLEKLAGIPDITLVAGNKVEAVIEVKHSRSTSYLSLARFKTLAYIYEYNANAGILIYPGLRNPKRTNELTILDEEYKTSQIIMEKAEEKGYITIRLEDDASLYIVPLTPEEQQEQNNINKIHKILNDIIFNNNKNR